MLVLFNYPFHVVRKGVLKGGGGGKGGVTEGMERGSWIERDKYIPLFRGRPFINLEKLSTSIFTSSFIL